MGAGTSVVLSFTRTSRPAHDRCSIGTRGMNRQGTGSEWLNSSAGVTQPCTQGAKVLTRVCLNLEPVPCPCATLGLYLFVGKSKEG